MADYLSSEMVDLPDLDRSYFKHYNVNFTDVPTVNPERQEQLNKDFIALLKDNQPSEKKLMAWLEEVCQLKAQGIVIGHKEQEKLRQSFESKKAEFALVMQSPGGINDIYLALHALGDGCVANFSTHVTNAVLRQLLKKDNTGKPNPDTEQLLRFYASHVATPFLNRSGDHLGGSASGADTNILQNREIRRHFLSENGVITKLAKSLDFASIGQCLSEKLGEDRTEAMNKLLDRKTYKHETSLLAAYLIVRDTLPELANSPYVASIKNQCDELIAKVDRHIAEQQRAEQEAREKKKQHLAMSQVRYFMSLDCNPKLGYILYKWIAHR